MTITRKATLNRRQEQWIYETYSTQGKFGYRVSLRSAGVTKIVEDISNISEAIAAGHFAIAARLANAVIA